MEMHQIRYFLAVARTLSFTQASEECHVAQPSLSRAIIKLEEELGGTPSADNGIDDVLTDASLKRKRDVGLPLELVTSFAGYGEDDEFADVLRYRPPKTEYFACLSDPLHKLGTLE